jgi:hypothetical protein
MHFRIVAALAAGVALAGCTMGLGEKPDARLVQSFKLQHINVAVAPNAKFWWAEGERAYARSIGRSEVEGAALGETPEGRDYMRSAASQRIKAAFDRELMGRLNGTRPVRVDVVMDDIYISSPIQQVFLGASFRMHGSARLVDVRTGEVIATNPDLTISVGGSGGVIGTVIDRSIAGDPMDRLASDLARSYRGWLLVS